MAATNPTAATAALSPEACATVKAVARHIRVLAEARSPRIAFLTGAGVSVAAGIPDFRSAGGMYDTLRPELLTATPSQRAEMADDPTAVVSRTLFQENQFPYFEVRRPFILGTAQRQWRPTAGHMLMRQCDERGLLRRIYTQNIDGLDHAVGGIDESHIVNVHGTICRSGCELCGAEGPEGGSMAWLAERTRTQIKDIYGIDPDAPKESTNIVCPKCSKAGMKPTTIMYGGAMPEAFFDAQHEDFKDSRNAAVASRTSEPMVDLMIVMGSSLTVMPAGGVPNLAHPECRKVLFNMEPAGPFAQRAAPVVGDGKLPEWSCALGSIDAVCVALMAELGWIADAAEKSDAVLCEASAKAIKVMAASAPTAAATPDVVTAET